MSPHVSKCPSCGQPAAVATAPFCSVRCREVDLHRWLAGSYRVPTDEAAGEGESPDFQKGSRQD